MNRDEAALLDIHNTAQRILLFAVGLTKASLATNEEKQSAILYQVIVIGEATKRLSTDFHNAHAHIPGRILLECVTFLPTNTIALIWTLCGMSSKTIFLN